MDKFILVLILLLVLIGAVIFLATDWADTETSRLNAQANAIETESRARARIIEAQAQADAERARAKAQVIEAQSQARLDNTAAIMPYLVLAIVGIFGFAGLAIASVFVLIFLSVWMRLRNNRQPVQNIYVLPRGAMAPNRRALIMSGDYDYIEHRR